MYVYIHIYIYIYTEVQSPRADSANFLWRPGVARALIGPGLRYKIPVFSDPPTTYEKKDF